jgi:GTP-binding protein
LNQLPETRLPEIAFVGRSNAGKSTTINTLAGKRRLAFASKTPGRTQHINLFEVGPQDRANALLVDLPGYGYAAVARDAKMRWQKVMTDYLSIRQNLTGIVLLVDSRHGITALDRQLLAFIDARVSSGAIKLLVVLTKSDKLNNNESAQAVASVQKILADEIATDTSDIGVLLFSALNRRGLDDLCLTLSDWAEKGLPPPQPQPQP